MVVAGGATGACAALALIVVAACAPHIAGAATDHGQKLSLRGPGSALLPFPFWDLRGLGVAGGLLPSEQVEELARRRLARAARNKSLSRQNNQSLSMRNRTLQSQLNGTGSLTGRSGPIIGQKESSPTHSAGGGAIAIVPPTSVIGTTNTTDAVPSSLRTNMSGVPQTPGAPAAGKSGATGVVPSLPNLDAAAQSQEAPNRPTLEEPDEPQGPLLSHANTEPTNGTQVPKYPVEPPGEGGPGPPLLPGSPLHMLKDEEAGNEEAKFDDILQINTIYTTALTADDFLPAWTHYAKKLLEKGLSTGMLSVKVAGDFKVPRFIAKQHWPRDEVDKNYPDHVAGMPNLPSYPVGDGVTQSESQLLHRTMQQNASRISLVHSKNVSKPVVNVTLGQGTLKVALFQNVTRENVTSENVTEVPLADLVPIVSKISPINVTSGTLNITLGQGLNVSHVPLANLVPLGSTITALNQTNTTVPAINVSNVSYGHGVINVTLPRGHGVSVVPLADLTLSDLSNISAASGVVPVHNFSMRCEDRSTNRTGMLQLYALTVSFARAIGWKKKMAQLLDRISNAPGSGGGCVYHAASGQPVIYNDVLEVFFRQGPNMTRTAERLLIEYKELVEDLRLPLADDSRVGVFREVGRVMTNDMFTKKPKEEEEGDKPTTSGDQEDLTTE